MTWLRCFGPSKNWTSVGHNIIDRLFFIPWQISWLLPTFPSLTRALTLKLILFYVDYWLKISHLKWINRMITVRAPVLYIYNVISWSTEIRSRNEILKKFNLCSIIYSHPNNFILNHSIFLKYIKVTKSQC
jgi:hypothetical protein